MGTSQLDRRTQIGRSELGLPRQNDPPGVEPCSEAGDAAGGGREESVLSTLKGLFGKKYFQPRAKRQRCDFFKDFLY